MRKAEWLQTKCVSGSAKTGKNNSQLSQHNQHDQSLEGAGK
jgi:hypothetical protein